MATVQRWSGQRDRASSSVSIAAPTCCQTPVLSKVSIRLRASIDLRSTCDGGSLACWVLSHKCSCQWECRWRLEALQLRENFKHLKRRWWKIPNVSYLPFRVALADVSNRT